MSYPFFECRGITFLDLTDALYFSRSFGKSWPIMVYMKRGALPYKF